MSSIPVDDQSCATPGMLLLLDKDERGTLLFHDPGGAEPGCEWDLVYQAPREVAEINCDQSKSTAIEQDVSSGGTSTIIERALPGITIVIPDAGA